MAPDLMHTTFVAAKGGIGIVLAALVVGCSPADNSPDSSANPPLQPLVYTEDPDHSPRAAAVRDRRLMRRLLEGASDAGNWGNLDDDSRHDLPELRSAEALGRALYRGIFEQKDRQWEHLFVSPSAYASLVDVSLEQARRYVDNKQAEAASTRRAFTVDKPSRAPAGGLASVFQFKRLTLGDGRNLQGDVVDGQDGRVVQHWNNRLVVGLADHDVEFDLPIRKILRTPASSADGSEETRLGVASDIEIGPQLDQFLKAGMHLKSSLLESYVYPFPLAVGNFWRYRRRLADSERETDQTSEPARPRQLPDGLHASRVTLRIESIDRYGPRRLVHLRFIYNDADLTRRNEFWLVTPRRIFVCSRSCRRRVDDLDWLLQHLQRQTPLLRFPLSRNTTWDSTFHVDEEWHNLELPGGSFFGTLAIEGVGPLADRIPFHRLRHATRFFAPSKGVVRRRYDVAGQHGPTIVESLVDYRIMSR